MTLRVELQTDRLLLRPFELSDVEDVLAYASDEDWSRYLQRVPYPYARQDAEEFIARSILRDWKTHAEFAIVLDGKVLGFVSLRIEAGREIAELAFGVTREHWGRGLMPEAARAIIDWAFQTYSLSKIFALTDTRNRQSWRVMEKLGMKREGVLRSNRMLRGERCDDAVYGLLRDEWESRKAGHYGPS